MELNPLGFPGYFRNLPGHECRVDLGEDAPRIDSQVSIGLIEIRIRLGLFGDGNIYPAMPGIPLPGNDNLLKKASGGKERQQFLLLEGAAVVEGKGQGHGGQPEDTHKNDVFLDIHTELRK